MFKIEVLDKKEIISDEEIEKVHGYANFGSTPKREVVDMGVLKVAFNYHCGHTARCILYEHGLIEDKYGEGYCLTTKGRQYLVACYDIHPRS